MQTSYTQFSHFTICQFQSHIPVAFQGYLLSGFLTLNQAIDEWALSYAVQQINPTISCQIPDIVTVPMPTYGFLLNTFYGQVGSLLGLVLILSTLYPVSRLVKSVVEEKESKMKEVMNLIGSDMILP